MCKKKILFVTAITVISKQKEFEADKVKEHVVGADIATEKPSLCFVHNPKAAHVVVEKVKDKKHHAVFFYDVPVAETKNIAIALKKKFTNASPKMFALQETNTSEIAVCTKSQIGEIITGLKTQATVIV